MKLRNRILSFALALLIFLNGMPVAYAAEGNTLTLNGNIEDAITDMEYGWDGLAYRFADNLLNGVEDGDEVYLVASVSTDASLVVGPVTITLSDFRLEGANAAEYSLPEIAEPSIVKEIRILPKTITITPSHPYIYYGQPMPKAISEVEDYTDQILPSDDVRLTSLSVNFGEPEDNGDLPIILQDWILEGLDADNYTIMLAPDSVSYISDYDPEVDAVCDDSDGTFAGVTEAVLHADGFLISKGNDPDGDWTETLTIALEETQEGSFTYYLRNNNSYDTAFYQAISRKKTYSYTSIQTKPTVQSIALENDDPDKTLNFFSTGVFGNGDVWATVKVLGASVAQNTTIYLGEDSDYLSKEVPASEATLEDGIYTYTASFLLTAGEEESIIRYLNAYAENSSGKGDSYPQSDNDTFLNTDTPVNKPFMIDKVKPVVRSTSIDGNYQITAIRFAFTVSDPDSGIAKVEYLWDDGFKLNVNDLEYQTEYVEFDGNITTDGVYELTLPWERSKSVSKNQHTLNLRVTDNAGNVYDGNITDQKGSDMLAPQIERLEIRKPQEDLLDKVIKYLSFGTFYNNTVEVVITAHDSASNEDFYSSGVASVEVNDRFAKVATEENVYILSVSPDSMMNGITVTVTDGVGLSTKAYVMDIPDHGPILNDYLIVEDKPPVIDFGDIATWGRSDIQGNLWFGERDHAVEMTVTVADTQGEVHSGLYSVTIKDNESPYLTPDFTRITTEYAQTISMGELLDGEHIVTVDAEDNCGNTETGSFTFYKDTVTPTNGSITVASPAGKIISGNQWFDAGDTLVFRVDASDSLSGISQISLDINGNSVDFEYGDIRFEGENGSISLDTSALEPNDEQKYIVTGSVTDFAANTLKLEPLTVYIDFENPVVEQFTVQKSTDALDKILNVLTFGVFSNDTLLFKVYTSDAQYDSGIDYATVQYEGLSTPIRMTDEGNGVFSTEISVNDSFFESDIFVTVYDKFGKPSVSCPNIVGAGDGASSNGWHVMIETISPTMTLSLPASDSVHRTDDQVWYNSNKAIEFTVQDDHSGIRNIDLLVNGVTVLTDKNNIALLKTQVTEAADARINDAQNYAFDTDYFTSIVGVPEDGKYLLAVQITDNAGNVTNYETAYYVDDIPPVIDSIDFIPQTADGIESTSEFVELFEYGYYFKTDFDITVNVSDAAASSGLYQVNYRFVPYQNGIQQAEINGSQNILDGKASLHLPSGFKGQIFVEAFDCVLNSSGEQTTKAFVVDNTAPDIQITKNVGTSYNDADGNPLYVETNSFTVVITDMVSGLRQIGYRQEAELAPYDRRVIDFSNTGYSMDDILADGWTVTGMDVNLVTQVTKTFSFSEDDNDVQLVFDAADRSLNVTADITSEKFTIDKTAPIINVAFRADDDTDVYYDQNRIADITIIERNFDASLIDVAINNAFGGLPSYSFTEQSNTEHTSIIDFDEGDYTFDVTGRDLGNHTATVNFSGGNEHFFYVDKTLPVIEENFAEFSNTAENSFRVDKTATIRIIEHNFDSELVNLRVTRKAAGEEHTASGLQDATIEILGGTRWDSSGDVHTISFTFDRDAVYYVELTPSDLAGNTADTHGTVIFEIDKTIPVVSMKNDQPVSEDNVEFLDVYPYTRKDDAAPTVAFEDLNLSHIDYHLTMYTPDYSTSDAVTVRPVVTNGTIDSNKYTLSNFTEDGVYAVELTAVDVAGNESVLNLNTYARMINQDVLAYIMESNLRRKTGLYSLEYENGEAISKKPSDFEDLKIFVMAQKDAPIEIVLRDGNGKEITTNAQCTMDDSLYGMGIYNYLLQSDFFKENFQDDTDIEMRLTVKIEGYRIDLGKIHIDNIAPACKIPPSLTSWRWFYGETDRTFVLSNISEFIDESQCIVYDNGKAVPFTYSSSDNTITFTLAKGWHNVGIVLRDMAGNENNIQEIRNIHIGYFWLWVIATASISALTVLIGFIIYTQNKKKRELETV